MLSSGINKTRGKTGHLEERINYSPYGLFCDNQCIKQFEESEEYLIEKTSKKDKTK